MDKVNYTLGNEDNIEKAVQGLNQFTKNWCMNCKETENSKQPIFRCNDCNFKGEIGLCTIKEFAMDKTGSMPIDFGSMSH